ncbi:MAG: hypothetical protein ABEJ88_05035 [Halobacterium sp.]
MDGTRDELAGVVDLFGGLTRSELADALLELAFRRGREVEEDAVDAEIEAAVEDYHLVPVDHDGDRLLAPGPVAFPSPPEDADDLPHILDVERRHLDREELAAAVRDRLESELPDTEPGSERARYLVDVTYDAEAWAPVDLADVREELAADA